MTICSVSSKRTSKKFIDTTLFDVSTGSWKNIRVRLRLRLCYPNMEVSDECDDPNAIHRWCRFKREVIKKTNYYKNHFSLTEEKQALLETTLDVNIYVDWPKTFVAFITDYKIS